ncbi:LOW QUALITY PROTEIN: uncharacterized protein LOC116935462 [Daphnia magna]|uniref:LOW QUALITY PROTEIN: uncharacterized protein LOC116935462 n=1 Tax=Daphnia magna TaxID=35525 RepID=UPI001E1BBFC7|nr:LOW QUALITY PROTEIN: uncharacterized protein LOC116935462 [Daphnia magna]
MENDYMNEDNPRNLFVLRTPAKRTHTTLLNRARKMLSRNASQQEFAAFRTRLNQAHARLVSIHQRYVQLTDLSDTEQHTAELYLQAINNQQLTCLRTIAVAMANRSERRRSWNVSNHDNASGNRTEPIPPNVTEDVQNAPLNNTAPNQINYQKNQQHDPTLLPTHLVENQDNQNIDTNSSNGQTNDRGSPTSNKPESDPAAAKKLKFDLEFKLRQKQLQKEREMKDLELKYAREQEDMLLEIQHIQQKSQLSDSPVSDQGPQFASTPVHQVYTTLPPPQGPVVYTGQPQLASSRNWPKLVVAKFDGDPRGCTKFAHGIKATLRDTNMPESLKLLALQDNLKDEIQKRVAHIFTSTHSFQSAWAVLESKYGSPGLIIQAHNQHLQQLPPFKHSDFNGLFNMAVAVRDAVSSVNQDDIVMFTSVVTSLCAKLPIHLQSDWGKLAYGLNRLPTHQDFDQWIDTVVGAEELRGIKLSASNTNNSGIKPPAYQYNANRQSNNQSPGSSNDGGRNPTILNQSLLTTTDIECPACKEKAKHRLELCNVFIRMLVNARATLCATNNHCFKWLIRGHFSSKCRRQNAFCTECNGPHHTLLHGAERQFPPSQANQGNQSIILMVRAPQPSILHVLLAIVPVVIEANGLSCLTSAVLDPGSEATLITRSLANLLHLQGISMSVQFGSFSSSVLIESEKVCFKLKSINGTHTTETANALVVPKINLSCQKINWPEIKHRWSHLASLEIPPINSDQVELLIGMDLSTTHQTNQKIGPIEGEDGPAAHHTRFGWAVAGNIPQNLVVGPSNKNNVNLQSTCLLPSLSSVVDQFRSLETFGIVPKPNSTKAQDDEDLKMVGMLHRSITFVNCGFRIALPLRLNFTTIPNNRNQALSRFYSIEHRLIQPDMRDIAIKYWCAIEKLIASGTAVHVNNSDINEPAGKVWYLPHFFVVNHNKPDKIRVVFDAAARFNGLCYNELLLRGPHSIPSLVGVLLRARQYRFALSADIEAFYHRIGVEKQDQSLQRFVFRPFGSSEPVRTFQFTTLIFGAVYSSSAAVQTLQYAAKSNNAFPQVAAKMRDNFYSDNLVDSFETENETVDFAKAVTKTLEAGGF